MENKSRNFPHSMMFGKEPRLPVDNNIGIHRLDEPYEPKIVQENARLNKIEAKCDYKRRYDKDCVTLMNL